MESTIRYKKVNGKRKPLCDYHGICKNLAYAEAYPDLGKTKKNSGWCYLCKKHLKQEIEKSKIQ